MNFKYKILKRNEHEPTLNVEYTPVRKGLAIRIIKVRYVPDIVGVLALDERIVHIHDLIVKAAPVLSWERESEVQSNQKSIEDVIDPLTERIVFEAEYRSLQLNVMAQPTMEIV